LRVGFAAVLASALALSGPADERAFALLADNRLVELKLPSGRVSARWALGPKLRGRVSPGRMLALRGSRVFALVQSVSGTDAIAVVDVRATRVRARYLLEPGVRYRGLLLVANRLYAFGGRYGRVVRTDPVEVREQNAVITTLDPSSGRSLGTTTVRNAEGRAWWILSAAARPDGSRIALSYHGFGTTGVDWLDVTADGLRRCNVPPSYSSSGCISLHGMIEPYGRGWIGATGDEFLLQFDEQGQELRRLHSGLQNEHLMNFTFTANGKSLLVLGSCDYSRGGLRRVSLTTGTSTVVRRGFCGEGLVVGRTALVVIRNAGVVPYATTRAELELRRPGSGRLLSRRTLSASVLDLVVQAMHVERGSPQLVKEGALYRPEPKRLSSAPR
jgi:hypothetical protein